MGIQSGYTTVKLSRSLKGRLEDYAKSRGLSLAGAIAELLDKTSVEEKLDHIIFLLEEQNRLLKKLLEGGVAVKTSVAEKPSRDDKDLPSFIRGNPWLDVLAGRATDNVG